MYGDDELAKARLTILRDLARPDETVRVYESLHGPGSAPDELSDASRHEEERKSLSEAAKPVTDIIDLVGPDGGEGALAVEDFTPALMEERAVPKESLEALYRLALCCFRFGDADSLESAARYLFFFLMVCPKDSPLAPSAHWGKLASEILTGHFDEAFKDCESMTKAHRDSPAGSKAMQLQETSWLAHWRLFALMRHDGWLERVVTECMNDATLDAIVISCPWLLRYVAAALIMRREQPTSPKMRALIRALAHDDAAQDDPILDLVRALLVRFDFADAEAQLARAESVIRSDFFLGGLRDADATAALFMESARQLVFETHCRLNSSVSITDLGAQLGLSADSAEEWVVGMIRKAHIDARIDIARGLVIMRVDDKRDTPASVVLSRTADLVARTQALQRNIEQAARGSKPGHKSGGGKSRDRHSGR